MVETFAQWISRSLSYLIPGSIYLTSVFFLFLFFLRKNDLKFFKSLLDYAPYLAIILLFLSYVVGDYCQILLDRIVNLLKDNSEIRIKMINYANVHKSTSIAQSYESIAYTFNKLVMIRHFIVSIICLEFSLFLWFFMEINKTGKLKIFLGTVFFFFFKKTIREISKLKILILRGFVFILIFLGIIYFIERKTLSNIELLLNFKHLPSTSKIK